MDRSSAPAVTLADLVGEVAAFAPVLRGSGAVAITGVRQDSRHVEPGELFVARRGERSDATAFIADAVARGAAAVAIETGAPVPAVRVPVLELAEPRRAAAFLAEAAYRHPSRELDVVGVTGTNGKTTISFLLEGALNHLGASPARLGTLGAAFAGESTSGSLTTPEADEVSRFARRVADRGASHLVMEVSSHALAQGRADALRFRAAAFSNLTQDHLDFHGSMREYGAAKRRLFTDLSPELSVIHVGDEFGRDLARAARGRVLTVGRRDADVSVTSADVTSRGIRAELATPSGATSLLSRLVGEHNLENLLVAFGVLLGLGFDRAAAAAALSEAPQVPGRLERCDGPEDDVLVLVDYAHTPDALERVLAAARRLGSGALFCVFGCGGDRDPKKRPLMGAAAAHGADVVFVTSDNPRSESPAAIVEQILPGLVGTRAEVTVELDRAAAIAAAVQQAAPGDTVLIAGKGHEDYQIIGAERRFFDDRNEARRALRLRRGA